MADEILLIGDLALNPDKVNDYLDASFNSRSADMVAAMGGAFAVADPDDEILPGRVNYVPQLAMPGELGDLDLTNESAKDSARGPTGVLPYGPVCSTAPSNPIAWFSHAIRAYKKSDGELEAWLGEKLAMRVVERRVKKAFYALRGAIGATSTVSHVEDETSASVKTLQVPDIFDARALLGDHQGKFRVMVVHSKPWNSIEKDVLTGTYNLMQLGDMTVITGIPRFKGMAVVIYDDATKVAGASAGADAYYTFLLGEGVVRITPAINSPLFTAVMDVDKGARSIKATIEDHFALNLSGMAMTTDATGNPTDAELYDTTNWSEAFSHDHRDFPAAYIKTSNG
jgi:hypothetical protein